MLTLVLWQHVVFLCVSCTLFRMSLGMDVHRMLCRVCVASLMLHSIRHTSIPRLILKSICHQDIPKKYIKAWEIQHYGALTIVYLL